MISTGARNNTREQNPVEQETSDRSGDTEQEQPLPQPLVRRERGREAADRDREGDHHSARLERGPEGAAHQRVVLQLPGQGGVMGQQVDAGPSLLGPLELVAVQLGQLVEPPPGEHVMDVRRIDGGMGVLGQLRRGPGDAPGRFLQREEHDRAQQSHRAGKGLGDGAAGVPERAFEVVVEDDHLEKMASGLDEG